MVGQLTPAETGCDNVSDNCEKLAEWLLYTSKHANNHCDDYGIIKGSNKTTTTTASATKTKSGERRVEVVENESGLTPRCQSGQPWPIYQRVIMSTSSAATTAATAQAATASTNLTTFNATTTTNSHSSPLDGICPKTLNQLNSSNSNTLPNVGDGKRRNRHILSCAARFSHNFFESDCNISPSSQLSFASNCDDSRLQEDESDDKLSVDLVNEDDSLIVLDDCPDVRSNSNASIMWNCDNGSPPEWLFPSEDKSKQWFGSCDKAKKDWFTPRDKLDQFSSGSDQVSSGSGYYWSDGSSEDNSSDDDDLAKSFNSGLTFSLNKKRNYKPISQSKTDLLVDESLLPKYEQNFLLEPNLTTLLHKSKPNNESLLRSSSSIISGHRERSGNLRHHNGLIPMPESARDGFGTDISSPFVAKETNIWAKNNESANDLSGWQKFNGNKGHKEGGSMTSLNDEEAADNELIQDLMKIWDEKIADYNYYESIKHKKTVRIDVPVPNCQYVSEIVGKQGERIKKLRQLTKTCIQTPSKDAPPVFRITGFAENVEKARQEILSTVEHLYKLRSQNVTIQLHIPENLIGLVIGKKGSTINSIREATNTFVVSPKRYSTYMENSKPNGSNSSNHQSDTSYFQITGKPEDVEKVRKEIEKLILEKAGVYVNTKTGVILDYLDNHADYLASKLKLNFK